MTHKTLNRKISEVHRFDFDDGSVAGELEKYYWVNDTQLSGAFGSNLPPRFADLVDLAMAVYHADRRAQRVRNPLVLTGQRDLRIKLPLRDLTFWNKREVTDRLTNLLYWFTEDQWTFTFVPRRGTPRLAETKTYLFPLSVNPPAAVVLFSGGLDSLAGLCTQLEKSPDHSFVLLSGWTHNRMDHIQRNLVKGLRRHWQSASRELISVAVPFGLYKSQDATREEPSQRSRGFVFLVLGAVAAAMAEIQTLWVLENGVGAVNLWLNEGQLGVDNARGVHPLSLIRMAEFLRLILDQSLLIENPFQFSTKAQMCQALGKPGLDKLATITVSCDSFPLRIPETPQCGLCTSCLLRRLALHASGLENMDPGDRYRDDSKKSLTGIKAEQLYPLHATLDQVDRLSTYLAADVPWVALTETFPELREIQEEMVRCYGTSAQEIADAFVRMYRTYVEEWEGFPLGPLAAMV